MIITCPNCQTKYQVAESAIGSAGRKVQCANCSNSWQAVPELPPQPPRPRLVEPEKPSAPPPDDILFEEADEAELDRAFEDEAQRTGGDGPAFAAGEQMDEVELEGDDTDEVGFDASLQRKRQRALDRRRRDLASKLPFARIRRLLRLLSLVVLGTLLGVGIFMRTDIVRVLPEMGGVYEAVGLGVNVIGLEFADVETLRTFKDGADVMVITATIRNVSGRTTAVPPVLVGIYDAEARLLYEWTALSQARVLGVGEAVRFETQLNSAPGGAERVRLIFSDAASAGAAASPTNNNPGVM